MTGRILIAEDDAAALEMLVIFAKERGYEVTTVSDGVELMQIVQDGERFDLIITDLMMARLSGASAVQMLKMQGVSSPIIAITALEPEYTVAIRDDFAKVFFKPCNYDELFDYVDSLVNR